jgi:hypothetical protein
MKEEKIEQKRLQVEQDYQRRKFEEAKRKKEHERMAQ